MGGFRSARLIYYFRYEMVGDLVVMGKIHAERAPAARDRSQLGRVCEDLGHRNERLHHVGAVQGVHPRDLAPSRIHVPDHIPHAFVRDHYFYLHNGFEYHGLRIFHRLPETHGARYLKGYVRRVDSMIFTVVEGDLHVHYRVARGDAPFHRLHDPLFHGGYEVLGNRSAHYVVYEFETPSPGERFYLEPRVAVLAPPARLLYVFAFGLGLSLHGFFVRHPRLLELDVYPVRVPQFIDNHLDVGLSGARNEELLRFLVEPVMYGRVFFHDPGERRGQLILVVSGFGLYGVGEHGRGELYGLYRHLMRLVGQRVPRGRVL